MFLNQAMLNSRRFELTVAVGLLPILMMAFAFAMTPTGALTLAGEPSSNGARLSATRLVVDGIGLYGSEIDGVAVSHFDLGELEAVSDLIIERDFRPSTAIPGAPTWTVRMVVPYAQALNTMDIYSSNGCVSGVGITNFGLFEGLVDPALNAALKDGHNPNLLTFLINIIGPSGLINFTIADLKLEAMNIQAGALRANRGFEISVSPQRVDPVFQGTCL